MFEGRPRPIVAGALSGVIAGLLYGSIVGAFSGLESPDPGKEPSDTARPLSEPAIQEEHEPDTGHTEGGVPHPE